MRITKTGPKLFGAHRFFTLKKKSCATCFSKSHTSKNRLRRKGYILLTLLRTKLHHAPTHHALTRATTHHTHTHTLKHPRPSTHTRAHPRIYASAPRTPPPHSHLRTLIHFFLGISFSSQKSHTIANKQWARIEFISGRERGRRRG